jgi:hypothetical protein
VHTHPGKGPDPQDLDSVKRGTLDTSSFATGGHLGDSQDTVEGSENAPRNDLGFPVQVPFSLQLRFLAPNSVPRSPAAIVPDKAGGCG